MGKVERYCEERYERRNNEVLYSGYSESEIVVVVGWYILNLYHNSRRIERMVEGRTVKSTSE